MQIRDRIKELRRVPARELKGNPNNWRRHPKAQRDALRAVLSDIGYAGALVARELADGSIELIDGHLRADLTPDADVPVLVLDVDEDEARLLLATFDPLMAMAEADQEAVDKLLGLVETDSTDLQAVLDELASEGAALTGSDVAGESAYTEQYGVIVICENEEHQERVYNELKEAGHNCRVVAT